MPYLYSKTHFIWPVHQEFSTLRLTNCHFFIRTLDSDAWHDHSKPQTCLSNSSPFWHAWLMSSLSPNATQSWCSFLPFPSWGTVVLLSQFVLVYVLHFNTLALTDFNIAMLSNKRLPFPPPIFTAPLYSLHILRKHYPPPPKHTGKHACTYTPHTSTHASMYTYTSTRTHTHAHTHTTTPKQKQAMCIF